VTRSSKLLLVSWVLPYSVCAQAWLFPKGEGAVSLSYQNIYVRKHVFALGEAFDRGHIVSHGAIVGVDYSLANRLAVRLSLPYIAAKYNGPFPHQLPVDGGRYHSSAQDLTIDLRYNVARRPLVITPFFTAVLPSHGYEYFAHSAVGRNVREYHVGANLGRRLNPVLPKAYLQARYSYAYVQRIYDVSPNRSNVEAQLGYFLKPGLSISAAGYWMDTHRGMPHPFGVPFSGVSEEKYRQHDQIGKARLLDLGGGLSYSVNPSLQVFVSVARSVGGRNNHLRAAVITVGFSRTFRTRLSAEPVSFLSAPAPHKNFVCTCARSK
jgi:hypothetical protein